MKIDNNCYNTNFRALKISHNAFAENLPKLNASKLLKIKTVGEKLEKTENYDLEILENLSMRIVKKGNKEFAMGEPIKISHLNPGEKSFVVTGVYKGTETPETKKGDHINMLLKFSNSEGAQKAYDNITKSRWFERMYYITKYIDRTASYKQPDAEFCNKGRLLDSLYDKFSDFI